MTTPEKEGAAFAHTPRPVLVSEYDRTQRYYGDSRAEAAAGLLAADLISRVRLLRFLGKKTAQLELSVSNGNLRVDLDAAALRELARTRAVTPSADAVAIAQDRIREKAHFARCAAHGGV